VSCVGLRSAIGTFVRAMVLPCFESRLNLSRTAAGAVNADLPQESAVRRAAGIRGGAISG